MLIFLPCPDDGTLVPVSFVLILNDNRLIWFASACPKCARKGDKRGIRNVESDPLPTHIAKQARKDGLPSVKLNK